jgi:DMSO/TMAO reductase YedYZ molybdopterin-dependent catalytic subunit
MPAMGADRVAMDPTTATRLLVSPERLADAVTATRDVFTVAHLGIAHVPLEGWSLEVTGLVAQPLRIGYEELRALPSSRFVAVHECFGNPLTPGEPVRRAAAVEWSGVRLAALLRRARPEPSAKHVWFAGLDHGDFAGEPVDVYLKDLPVATATDSVLLAYAMNGEPLSAEHGFPVRTVVPGFFGTNSVKWLSRITLAAERPEHLFTTRLYMREVERDGRVEPVPVRELDVNSLLVTPVDREQVPAGSVEVTGWAWSVHPVTEVEVSVDDEPWQPAHLAGRGDTPVWQRFACRLELGPGSHTVRCQARDAGGRAQPPRDARNAVHEIGVTAR